MNSLLRGEFPRTRKEERTEVVRSAVAFGPAL